MATPKPKRPKPVKFDTSFNFGANARPRGGAAKRPRGGRKGGGS